MNYSLFKIAKKLNESNKKVQLIYAFNGTGKTRLSRVFKKLISGNHSESEEEQNTQSKIIYYNAFTEDLFYWDNDLGADRDRKLKIQPNGFTDWILKDQGQDQNIIGNFQHYTSDKLTPHFNIDFSEVTFSYEKGDDDNNINIKISRGEESVFVWSVFYSLVEEVINILNVVEPDERETNDFDELNYIFIDDPVSSLDENNLIELAVNLAQLIKSSESDLRFIITTHNPLFYNVLYNELKKAKKWFFKKNEDGTYNLDVLNNDSPFSYHLYLKKELERAIETGNLQKYHFNYLRNILEKTSTFLGFQNWGDLLPKITTGSSEAYQKRIINISSHSSHSSEEVYVLNDNDKRVLRYLVDRLNNLYKLDLT